MYGLTKEEKLEEEKKHLKIKKETGFTIEELEKRFQWIVEAKQVCLFYNGRWRETWMVRLDSHYKICQETGESHFHEHLLIYFSHDDIMSVGIKQFIEYCRFYDLLVDDKKWDKRKRELASIWMKNNRAENKEFDIRWEQIKAEEDPYKRAERIEEGRRNAKARKEERKNKPRKVNDSKKADDDSLCMWEQLTNILIEKGHMKPNNK